MSEATVVIQQSYSTKGYCKVCNKKRRIMHTNRGVVISCACTEENKKEVMSERFRKDCP